MSVPSSDCRERRRRSSVELLDALEWKFCATLLSAARVDRLAGCNVETVLLESAESAIERFAASGDGPVVLSYNYRFVPLAAILWPS